MKLKWILALAAATLPLQIPSAAQAFECPKHFAEAQEAIEKAIASVKGMESKMSEEGVTVVRSHIINAKMTLAEAQIHHENPEGFRHHARAIMKANTARGHASAAIALHNALMKL